MEQRLSLITLGVGDVSRAQGFYEALGWHLNGGWRPCARRRPRPAPCSGQPAYPRRPGRRREGRRQLGHGIDSSPESRYKRATSLRKHS
jgi:hypothetical protein